MLYEAHTRSEVVVTAVSLDFQYTEEDKRIRTTGNKGEDKCWTRKKYCIRNCSPWSLSSIFCSSCRNESFPHSYWSILRSHYTSECYEFFSNFALNSAAVVSGVVQSCRPPLRLVNKEVLTFTIQDLQTRHIVNDSVLSLMIGWCCSVSSGWVSINCQRLPSGQMKKGLPKSLSATLSRCIWSQKLQQLSRFRYQVAKIVEWEKWSWKWTI